MRIRGKLICAFLINTLMPTILIGCTFWGLYHYQTEKIRKLGIKSASVEQCVVNPIQIMNQVIEEGFNELKVHLEENEKCLEDISYLEDYNKEILWEYSFLVVQKEEKDVYVGNQEEYEKIRTLLSEYIEYNSSDNSCIYLGGERNLLIKQAEVQFPDGNAGRICIVTDVSGFLPAIKEATRSFFVAALIISGFTALVLMLWIHKGIIKPINVLKTATYKMRDGDLDFTVRVEGNDEISELCKDFENMRIRLKASIDSQIEYEERMREMISNISHDLKTPLTTIDGYTEGILDGVANTPEKKEKYLKVIHHKAQEMSSLVNELSACAKLENGMVAYHFQVVRLEEFWVKGREELATIMEEAGIDLRYESEVERDTCVIIDPEKLVRVFSNIIGNSIKFMEKKTGKILIKVSQSKNTPNMLQIEVRDNGRGISKEKLAHIFDRFYRGDSSRNSKIGGSGLGLAISKKIVEEHGGTIWAESEEGVGTSIFLTLRKEKI